MIPLTNKRLFISSLAMLVLTLACTLPTLPFFQKPAQTPTLTLTLIPTSTSTPAPSPTLTPTTTSTPSPTLTPTATPIYPLIEDFVGLWINIDPDTREWTKIEIWAENNLLYAHFWGSCSPTDCDAGITSAQYEGNPVKMFIDHEFATRDFTLFLDSNSLKVTTFSHYTDDSGRADRTSECFFEKE